MGVPAVDGVAVEAVQGVHGPVDLSGCALGRLVVHLAGAAPAFWVGPVTEPLAHDLRVQRDEQGVIVWCSCRRWGYAGPDEDAGRDAHAAHVRQDAEEGGDGEPV